MKLTEISTHFKTKYESAYALNDSAHRESHFKEVEEAGLHINRTLELGIDEKLIVIVAWVHDLFAWSRHNHHFLSSEWVRTTDDPVIRMLDMGDRFLISYACKEHRASYTGNFSSLLSEVMSSADRGFSSNEDLFRRALEYSLNKSANVSEALESSVQHVKEKFGRGGYARLPDIYKECYKNELEERYQWIDELDMDIARTLIGHVQAEWMRRAAIRINS